MAATPHASRRQARPARRRRWLIALVTALVVAGLLAFAWLWALPLYVEKRLVDTFSTLTGRDVSISSVDVNPLTARLVVDEFRVAGEAQTPVFISERIEADIKWHSLWSPGWRLDSLSLHAPRLQLIWQENARWNVVELFGGDSQSQSREPTPIRIARVAVSEGRLDWVNRRLDEPVTLSLERVQVEAQDYASTSSDPFSLQGQADWNGGRLSGEGEMGFSPWTVDVSLTAEQLPLTTLSGYLAHVVRARASSGTLAAQLRVQAGRASDSGTRVSGQGEVQGIEMLAPEHDRPIATGERLAVKGLVFESARPHLLVERVILQAPWLDVTIDERLETNLTAWRPPRSPQETGESSRNGTSMRYAIDTLAIKEGEIDFADRHLPQPFTLNFSALQGEWRDLASAREGDGQLTLEGQVAEGSPMRIEGAFDPLGDAMRGNLNLHFERLPLTAFAPYLREFGGYAVEQGQATLDLDYRLENGRLQASNHLVLRQIELGEQVDASATDLPVKALVGVLQGEDGVIELDIPMTLPLDNPSSVDFGRIAGQAIREALENLVTSPLETLSETMDGNGNGNGNGNAEDGPGTDGDDRRGTSGDDTTLYERARTPL